MDLPDIFDIAMVEVRYWSLASSSPSRTWGVSIFEHRKHNQPRHIFQCGCKLSPYATMKVCVSELHLNTKKLEI